VHVTGPTACASDKGRIGITHDSLNPQLPEKAVATSARALPGQGEMREPPESSKILANASARVRRYAVERPAVQSAASM
jgi:hypothetical protein